MDTVFLRRAGNFQMSVWHLQDQNIFKNNGGPSHISENLKFADLFGWWGFFGCFGLLSPLKSVYKQTA